jgi:hypothetical protein
VSVDRSMIQQTAAFLLRPGTVTELRILHTPRNGTVSGYFDDPQVFVQAAQQWSGRAPAVYAGLNPCTPALLARAANRLKDRVKSTTSDKDIVQRYWFPLDFDPVRPADISATDAEHDAALQRAEACASWLRSRGWPAPVAADSGNGGIGSTGSICPMMTPVARSSNAAWKRWRCISQIALSPLMSASLTRHASGRCTAQWPVKAIIFPSDPTGTHGFWMCPRLLHVSHGNN